MAEHKNRTQSWRHHHVPQFYLRYWAINDGRLWEHSRAPHTSIPRSRLCYPKETGWTRCLNSLEAEPIVNPNLDPDGLEKRLGVDEDKAGKLLKKLLECNSADLSQEEKETWSRFLYLQLERDPDRVRQRVELGEEARKEVLTKTPWLPADSPARDLFSGEMARNMAKSWLVRSLPGSDEWMKNVPMWRWIFVHLRNGFITTDMPVLLNTMSGVSGMDENLPVSMISVALSPDVLLACFPESWMQEVDEDWLRLMTVTFNGRLLSLSPRYIYSSVPLGDVPSAVTLEEMAGHYLRFTGR